MNDGWQFHLSDSALHFLLSRRAAERVVLLKTFDELLADPYQSPTFTAADSTGRKISGKLAGKCIVYYWLDHLVKEIRIIKLIYVR